MLQRSSRICWKWVTFWKAWNKQNTWECWTRMGCNQERVVPQVPQSPLQSRLGALRLLAFPKTKITLEREEISNHRWDSGKYDRAADGNYNKGVCRVFWTVEEMLGELCEVPSCLLWRELRCHCLAHNVYRIFFNKCLCFSYYMAGYFLNIGCFSFPPDWGTLKGRPCRQEKEGNECPTCKVMLAPKVEPWETNVLPALGAESVGNKYVHPYLLGIGVTGLFPWLGIEKRQWKGEKSQ